MPTSDPPPGPRVRLRRWRPEDRAPFAALNADPEVMEHFAVPLERAASDALVDRIEAHFARHGFGLWALEVPGVHDFAGFVGLAVVPAHLPVAPAVEIGWRLARAAWGQGYAGEAARLALAHAFGPLGLREVVSFTARRNERSQRLMRRLGMVRDPSGDFDHPALPPGHPLRPHVLYRARPPAPAG